MKQQHIDKIVELFKEVKIWNGGKFMDLVATYCREESLDFLEVSRKLEIAFRDVLTTNITSENAIRFRLKNSSIMKPELKTVYLPVKVEDELPEIGMCKFMFNEDNDFVSFLNKKGKFTEWFTMKNYQPTHWLKQQEAIVFTPEQLNEYTANVIKQALKTAAENADLAILKKSQYSKKARWKKVSKKEAEEGVDLFSYEIQYKPSKKSITNTFEEVFKKFKI